VRRAWGQSSVIGEASMGSVIGVGQSSVRWKVEAGGG
jgi:hypothetical protein